MTARPSCAAATLEHAATLAPLLSSADRREIAAASGLEPAEVLRRGVSESETCRAYLGADGVPFALQGVMPGGRIWLLSSDRIRQPGNRWFFARRAKADLAEDQARFGRLFNMIDSRNAVHMRLLEWLGFEFGAPVDHGGVAFVPFWRDKDV